MLKFFFNPTPFSGKKRSDPSRKLLLTCLVLFLFRLGNTIPLGGIDQEALTKTFLQIENTNALFQLVKMYSGAGGNDIIVTPLSLGIIPYINSSIFMDLLTTVVPQLEKLNSEEGEVGKQTLFFYKKIVTVIFATVQSFSLLYYLKTYLYFADFWHIGQLALDLIGGSLIMVWFTNLIDNQGIGNGTSLFIFINILSTSLTGKTNWLIGRQTPDFLFDLSFLLLFSYLIYYSQMLRFSIPIVSARQLSFLEVFEKLKERDVTADLNMEENGLILRLTQAGIFPIIIASNLLPVCNYFFQFFWKNSEIFLNFIYYFLIVSFNYFYTSLFWDPEKITEQLRKNAVAIVNIRPGLETTTYLQRIVLYSSIAGGILLCFLLVLFEIVKLFLGNQWLSKISISSMIIFFGILYELQKTLLSFYKVLPEKDYSAS